LKPLPQSLVTEKFTVAWGKVVLVEELVPETGVGVATGVGAGVGVATGVGVGVAEGAGVGVAEGVATGVGDGVEVPVPEGLPIRGARLDWR
jgi:hypothetical protein